MTPLSMDPLLASVQVHLAELSRQAQADRAGHAVRANRRRSPSWPAAVASALRDSLISASRPGRTQASKPCVSC